MINIFLSSKHEKKLLDYELKKFNDKNLDIYQNDNFRITITGLGAYNMSSSISYIIGKFGVKKNDFIVNFGFAGAKDKNLINKIFRINKINDFFYNKNLYMDITYNFNLEEMPLISSYKPLSNSDMCAENLYDMEGASFFNISRKFFQRQNILIFKMVSDNGYENFNLKSIKNNNEYIKNIFKKIYNLSEEQKLYYKKEKIKFVKEKIYKSKFTKVQKDRLIKFFYEKILSDEFVIKNFEKIIYTEFKHKKERNMYIEKIINKNI